MRLILDECIPRRFKTALFGHACLTVPEAGFAGYKNGRLLAAMESGGFEVFLTLDKGIEYQQRMTGRNLAIIVIRAKSNRLQDLVPHSNACLAALESIQVGAVIRVF